MSPEHPPGPRGLPPAEVEAFLRRLIDELLREMPETQRAQADETFAKILADRLETRPPTPAQAGGTILFGEAARDAIAAEIVKVAELHKQRIRRRTGDS